MEPSTGQVALVTGASRGLGRCVAMELARRGLHVVALARDGAALRALAGDVARDGGRATPWPMDLSEADELETLGPRLRDRFGRLDALAHVAAALGPLVPLEDMSLAAWRDVLAANLTASWGLIQACGPLLRAAPAGRAVFVSSSVARQPRAGWGGYGAGKAGMEHLVQTWAAETDGGALRVNLFDPGRMRTDMRREAAPGEDPMSVPDPGEIAPLMAALCMLEEERHGTLVKRVL